jgi:WD40 repeat protein
MIVLQQPTEMGGDRTLAPRPRWSAQGRQVRMVLLTWPMVALLGATVAAATCLLTDCDRCGRRLAKETLVGDAGSVKSTAFRPDGTMLSSVGIDGSVTIWDMSTRVPSAFTPRGLGPVHGVAFSPDNRLLAAGSVNAVVSFYDLDHDTSKALDDTQASTVSATCLAFSADGATLAVGQADGRITLWDAATGRKLSTLGGHEEFIVALAFSPDDATLASSGSGHLTRIWDVPTGRERFAIAGRMNTYVALAFSPDGRMLAMGDQVSPIVKLWDMTNRTERASLRGPAGAVVGVAISPDGTTLAAADFRGTVTFWDMASLELRRERLRHSGVRSLAFAPDGTALATGGFDGTIKLWASPWSSGD